MWHCPHCGAPQAETARCWVCRKSSTTCSTCRQFRLSLTADVGWCALDAKRRPLTGLEQRGCWQEQPVSIQSPSAEGVRANRRARGAAPDDTIGLDDHPPLDFVPVELVAPFRRRTESAAEAGSEAQGAAPELPTPLVAGAEDSWADRISLFGDLEA